MGIFYVSDIHKIAGLPVETQCNVIVTKTTKTVFRIELNNVWTGETWEATYASGNTVSSFIARASKDNLDALAARVTALENS